MRDGPQEWELFFLKGFRYLQLTFRNCSKPVELESVKLLFSSYPVKYRGLFECSDPLLTKIWDVGRWTLQLCSMYNASVRGIKMKTSVTMASCRSNSLSCHP